MSLTKNGKRIGMAAHNERLEIAQYLRDCRATEIRRISDEIISTCRMIRDLLSQREYDAWWDGAPDDDLGFLAAAHAKLAELQERQLSAEFLECERIQNWLEDNWDTIPEMEL